MISGTRDADGRHGRAWLLWACLLYVAVAGLWIIASDTLLGLMTDDPGRLTQLQTYKGWLFVAVSAALLYGVGRKAAGSALPDGRPPAGLQGNIPWATSSVSGLQRLIIAGSIVLVLATLLLVGYGLGTGRGAVLRQGRENAENLAHVIEAQTLHAVESVDLTLRSLNIAIRLSQGAAAGRDAAIQEQMQQSAKSLSHVREVFVVNEHGRLILDTDAVPVTPIDFSDLEYFAAHRENPGLGLFISAPIVSRSVDRPFIAVSRRIEKPGGGFGGVIVAAVEEQYFRQLYASLNVGREGMVALHLRNGTLLVRAPHAEQAMGKSFAYLPVFREFLEKSVRGSYRGPGAIDGAERIFSYRAVPDFPLVVFVGLSEREALAGWYRTARIEFLAALLFVLAIAILAYALIVQLRRREALTDALKAGEQRYRYLFDANPRPMWLRDIEIRRILDVNRAAVALYGYSREEFFALPAEAPYPPEEVERRKAFIGQRGPEADSIGIWRHIRKDGSVIDVEVASRFFVVDGRRARLSLITDVTEKRRAEKLLQESEERYRYLFDSNPLPMWIYDYETLKFIAVNDAAVNIYGYTREEFLSMSILDIRPEEEVNRIQERLKTLNPAENRSGIWKHKKKNGDIIHVDIVSHGFVFGGRKARLVLASDVTERVRVEHALRASEQRLQTITDNIPALIGYVDSGQRYRFANRTYEVWHGDAPEQLYGRTLREVVGDDYYAKVRPHIEAVLAGRAVTFERLTRSRRRELYASITYLPDIGEKGRVEGFYILAYDITERKKAEEALARERTLLRQVIDNLPDHVYVKDRERRYLLINAPGLQDRGITDRDEVVGKTAFDFYPPDVAAQYDAEDQSIVETGRILLNLERCTIQADGQKKWHLSTKVPMRDVHGGVSGIVGINHDITEIKQGQEVIREFNARLEQRVIERTAQLESANRELESFAYSVSHDLRAPLRSIDGFSQALLEDYRDSLDQTAKGYLQRVRSASQRMAVLIDDLLELSRIARREMHRETVDFSMLAQEIVTEMQKEQPERTVDVSITPGIRLRADANLLRIALDNLIRNAWKFTGKQVHAKIEVGMEQRDGSPVYFVRDNGVGFDMDYAGKLFGAFQRLHSDAEFPGTGIGLATVQRIVRRHGGSIWAEAAPGKGAAFFFTIGAAAD
ncbi:MAG: PAS domain S-box protein [Pseudomonadota bacterium]